MCCQILNFSGIDCKTFSMFIYDPVKKEKNNMILRRVL